MIDHADGYTIMRLHCTLPNGAHYLIDEDDWHVGEGDAAIRHAEVLNAKLEEANSDVRIAQVVGFSGRNIFTIVDTAELAVMSETEQYAHEQCLDASWDTEMELDREFGYHRYGHMLRMEGKNG